MCTCADPVCAGSLLGSRTSDVSERRAREQQRRQKGWGNLLQGRRRAAELQQKPQGLAGACPGRS